jgi:superfamily II DNA/RNA helicase
VLNFDVPTHPEDYVHRIGRTGRAGRKGTAITLYASEEGKYVQAIEELIKHKLERRAVAGQAAPETEAKPEREMGRKRGQKRGRRVNASSQEADASNQDHMPAFLLRPVRRSENSE